MGRERLLRSRVGIRAIVTLAVGLAGASVWPPVASAAISCTPFEHLTNGCSSSVSSDSSSAESDDPVRPTKLEAAGQNLPLGSLSVADLPGFRPEAGVVGQEPVSAAVGEDINFYSLAKTQVIAGLRAGSAVQVRLTPLRYEWDYGDGETATFRISGAPWRLLSLADSSRTSTSHRYGVAGNYTVRLTVVFAEEYRSPGSEWTRVRGSVGVQTTAPNTTQIRAG